MATWFCFLLVAAAIFASSNAKDEFKQLKSMMRTLESKVTEQQQTIKMLTSIMGSGPVKRQAITEGPVVFSTALTNRSVDHMTDGQEVIFDKVLTNIGGGYDSSTGMFTVPLSGLYMITSSLMDHFDNAHGTSRLHGEIVQNGNLLARVFAHADDNNRDQGSNTVFIQATKGDRIWVRVVDNKNLSLGVTDEVLSALSNVLQAPLLPALDLVDSRNVTLLVTPSGRKLYQVVGSSSTPYTCFPGNCYCSCPSYKFSVMKKEEHAMCKHVLAVRLSNAMGVTKVLDVSNEELTDLLLQLE